MREVTYSKLSAEDQPQLLEAISEIFEETEAHDKSGSSLESWNWQYQYLPSKDSYVYIAKLNKKIIGYYHIPTYDVEIDNKIFRIGHIQSVAVLNEYRKDKVFKRLAEYANYDVKDHVDLIYTFPNDKSIHTFIKYNGFSHVSSLPMYIYPIDLTSLLSSKLKFLENFRFLWSLVDKLFLLSKKMLSKDEKIEECGEITSEIEEFINKFHKTSKVNLLRSQEYLTWRYLKSPKADYQIFTLRKESVLKSVIVLKKDNLFSVNGLIIMDFVFKEIEDLSKILSNIERKFFHEERLSFILIAGMRKELKKIRYSGFLRVPNILVPRKLNLLTKSTNKKIINDLKKPDSWFISLGDWDVF